MQRAAARRRPQRLPQAPATAADAGDEDDEVALPELSLEHLLSAHTDRPMWWTTSRWA